MGKKISKTQTLLKAKRY